MVDWTVEVAALQQRREGSGVGLIQLGASEIDQGAYSSRVSPTLRGSGSEIYHQYSTSTVSVLSFRGLYSLYPLQDPLRVATSFTPTITVSWGEPQG